MQQSADRADGESQAAGGEQAGGSRSGPHHARRRLDRMQRRKVVGAMVTPPRPEGASDRPRVTFESQAGSSQSSEEPAQQPDDCSDPSQNHGYDAAPRQDPSMTLDISRDEGTTLGYSCPPSLELCASEAHGCGGTTAGGGGGGGGSNSDSESDEEPDEEVGSAFLPTQRQEVRDNDDDEEAQDGGHTKGPADEPAQNATQQILVGSAAFSEADAGSLSAQLAALQEHRKQRASDKRHWETVDSDLAERIAALIAERGDTQRRWVRKCKARKEPSLPLMHGFGCCRRRRTSSRKRKRRQ